jgi:hypothetical protein
MYQRIVAGITGCLLRRDPAAVPRFLATAAAEAPTEEIRRQLLAMRQDLLRLGSPGK